MCSQRFTDSGRLKGFGILLLAAGLATGCVSAPLADGAAGDESVGGADQEIPARVLTLYEQATAAMANGDDTDAELRFKEFLLQHPDYPGAYVNLAILSARQGDDLAAEAHIQDALRIDPDCPPALNQLGMLKRRQGLFDESESAYLMAVTASPAYALAHYNLGVLNELYLQRLDTALLHFERYLELGGEDEQVEKWVADLKRRIGASQRTANVRE